MIDGVSWRILSGDDVFCDGDTPMSLTIHQVRTRKMADMVDWPLFIFRKQIIH